MSDQTQEGSAGEPQIELELAPVVPTEPQVPGGDPLDAIQDPEARAEAKKARAIVRRHGKKIEELDETPAAPVAAPLPQGVLTKADFEKSNEKRAIRLATADPEVKANWAEISPFYTPRHGRETPEDILEDIKDAITVFKSRQAAPVVPDDTAADLTVSHGAVGTGGGVAPSAPKTPNPPNFKLPTTPKDWYAKPNK